ncbi:MAG: hypothetical protein QNK22_04955 [Xanthomonadales bacterium]|nr:hypothetical protein [Xanthomonadales bacterium]
MSLSAPKTPVIFDDIKPTDELRFLRSSYFSIEREHSCQHCHSQHPSGVEWPFILRTPSGVIIQPPNHEHSYSPDPFESLFESIGRETGIADDNDSNNLRTGLHYHLLLKLVEPGSPPAFHIRHSLIKTRRIQNGQ